ncbi:PTS system [Cutibacterium acnes JCM 18918]|nr:PTS system [Cutibacterium acnes JCM 18918]
MKPKAILATIAGGMSGLAIGVAFHAGLVAPASPARSSHGSSCASPSTTWP